MHAPLPSYTYVLQTHYSSASKLFQTLSSYTEYKQIIKIKDCSENSRKLNCFFFKKMNTKTIQFLTALHIAEFDNQRDQRILYYISRIYLSIISDQSLGCRHFPRYIYDSTAFFKAVAFQGYGLESRFEFVCTCRKWDKFYVIVYNYSSPTPVSVIWCLICENSKALCHCAWTFLGHFQNEMKVNEAVQQKKSVISANLESHL